MKITRIEVSNVAGLARADINLATGALLVAGANMSGKSSLRDAISMALTGTPARVSKKNQLSQMLHNGAKKGRATVYSGEEIIGQITLPKGEFAGPDLKNAEYLPLVLDPARFAAMSSDERRTTLFKITGCSAGMKTIEPMLQKRGIDMAVFEEVKPMLRSGFPAAEKFAQERARDGKASWKAVTGEQWGSEKAEGWEPDQVTTAAVDQAQIDEVATQLQTLEQDLADAQQTLGGHRQAMGAAVQRNRRIAELTETAALLERRQAKLDADNDRMAEWAQKLINAEQAASGETGMACPCCDALLVLRDGALHQHSGNNADPEAAKRVTEYEGYLASAQRAVENSKRDVQQSKDAAAQVEALQQEAASIPDEEAIANAEQVIADLRQERDRLNAKKMALQDAMDAAANREKTIANAAAWHAEVTKWLAIADAMSPDGIPADLLQQALTPINDSLAVLSRIAGWPLVEITKEIEVTSQGRPYLLASESEKWRADTLLALAIAQITELRLVLLDRFDVLEPNARGQLIGLVSELVSMESIDTVIMLGTLKEKPAALPEGFTGAWISNNIVEA